jgi:hypothetical protein
MDNSSSAVVLDALYRACSQDASVLKPAEEQLKQWETQPGFYSILAVSSYNFLLQILSFTFQAYFYEKYSDDRGISFLFLLGTQRLAFPNIQSV